MGKNKDDEDTDKFSALEVLIGFHSVLTQTPTPREGINTALDKLEEHINDLLNSLNFNTDEEPTE